MAWSASGLFVATHIDQWDASNLGIDLGSELHKAAFWGTVTPNFDTDTAYGASPWNSGEASGAGYSAGGPLLTGTTLSVVSGSMKWDADNVQLDDSTITAQGVAIYADAVSDRLICAVWFGAEKETQDGTFLITWHANGIAALDLTPA
jgi:hypothetical protein